jgi:SAM-dependent methyltransferase
MLKAALYFAQKLNYKLFLAPKGYGMAIPTTVLEQQYKEGFYDFLNLIDERANYMVAIGYIQHFAESLNEAPRILDLGCGHGRLPELLTPFSRKSYVGLDKSAEAIKQAEAAGFSNSKFLVADFEEYTPDEKFDFIVSLGSIHYVPDAAAVLKRFTGALSENGVFIVSLWRHGHNAAIWKNIEEHFDIIDSTVVTNKKGISWDIKVLRNEKPAGTENRQS